MEGIHDEWLFSDNRNYVSFSHLPPGEYIFRVKGSNDDGVWNERGAVLKINILPPFWMTTWFRITIAVIVLTGSVLLIRYITTRKLKKKIREMKIQNKIQQERQQISDDLHDHIGSHLSNIITGLEISGHLIPQKEKTRLNDHILNLEKYTRDTISELRQTIGSLNQKESSIKLLAEHISNLVEDQARLNNKTEIKLNFKPDDRPLSPLYSLNIFRICQEALNNAIKYSKAAEILINLYSGKGLLLLKISDNGVGFKYPDVNIKENGQGLPSMQRRAERMGGKLTIHSSAHEGTTIELTISIEEK
jgi:signal transduction histidine kinase